MPCRGGCVTSRKFALLQGQVRLMKSALDELQGRITRLVLEASAPQLTSMAKLVAAIEAAVAEELGQEPATAKPADAPASYIREQGRNRADMAAAIGAAPAREHTAHVVFADPVDSIATPEIIDAEWEAVNERKGDEEHAPRVTPAAAKHPRRVAPVACDEESPRRRLSVPQPFARNAAVAAFVAATLAMGLMSSPATHGLAGLLVMPARDTRAS